MFQGNWVCASCGTAITELSFNPRQTDNLKCLDCFKKSKGNGAGKRNPSDRPRFEGNWKCKNCGAAVTNLPFDPKDRTDNIKCLDCYRAQKDQEVL